MSMGGRSGPSRPGGRPGRRGGPRSLGAALAALVALAACGGGSGGGSGGGEDAGDDAGAGRARTTVPAAPARPSPGAGGAELAQAAAEAAEDGTGAGTDDGTGGEGGDAFSAEAWALLDDYGLDAGTCTETDAEGATAAVSCDFAPVTYDLARYPDAGALAERFAALVAGDGATPRDWWYADAPDTVMGAMYAQASGGRSAIRWTNEDRLVVGHAWQDGDDAATRAALEDWWSSDGSTAAPPPG